METVTIKLDRCVRGSNISAGGFTYFEPSTPVTVRIDGGIKETIYWTDEEGSHSRQVTTNGVSSARAFSMQNERINAFMSYGRSHQNNPLDSTPMIPLSWQGKKPDNRMFAERSESGKSITISNVDVSDRDRVRWLGGFGSLCFLKNAREAHFSPDPLLCNSFDTEELISTLLIDLNTRILL